MVFFHYAVLALLALTRLYSLRSFSITIEYYFNLGVVVTTSRQPECPLTSYVMVPDL